MKTTKKQTNNGEKITEHVTQVSSQLMPLIMNNIPQAVFWKDHNLVYLGCNQAFAEDAGFPSPEEIIGKTDFDMPWKDQAELYRADDHLVLENGKSKLNYEEPQTTPDGYTIWLNTSKIPLYENGQVVAVLGMYEDITERKQAEEAITSERQRFQTILESVRVPMLISRLSDGIVLYANQAIAQVSQVNLDKLIGFKTGNFYANTDDRKTVLESLQQHGRISDFEVQFRRTDGSLYWALLTSHIINYEGEKCVLSSYVDITERKQLEQQIQTAFERRGLQVQLSTQVSQSIATAASLAELYQRVVTQVKEQFGFYHAQILRYDAAQEAVVLVTGYGEVGAKMLAAGHRMPMGEGLIGTAAATGETVLRSVLENDPDWYSNPLLPETKGEIAVPIKLGDTILGVLDVQSNVPGVLDADTQLLLEGLCGQIATAIESTRLRQEMAERLEEINRLYRAMSHEGWQVYRQTGDVPAGFIYDQIGVVPIQANEIAEEPFIKQPIAVPDGETIGTLSIADDPQHPLSSEDISMVQQISEQVALALESARLFDQTQSALAQSEKLFDASRSLTQATDLQELVAATVKTLGIPVVNRAVLTKFDYDSAGEIEQLTIIANWWNGDGHEVTPVGTRYPLEVIRVMPMFVSPTPVFFDDAFKDERVDAVTMELVKKQNLRAVAVLPLHTASEQIGALILEAENPHNFTPAETRLFSSLAPQIATVLENRQQYEKAQHQAEREAMLNLINQKIQSATSVDAVLQIAARELGHALGAPMTIAQLSMRDRN
jgi:PAS domain S-box-containing protein